MNNKLIQLAMNNLVKNHDVINSSLYIRSEIDRANNRLEVIRTIAAHSTVGHDEGCACATCEIKKVFDHA